jgi:hypothetical protein
MPCALRSASRVSSTVSSTVVESERNAPLPATVSTALAAEVLSGRFAEDVAVVVAEGEPEAVQLAPDGFQQGPDRLPAILRFLDHLGPRLGCVAKPHQIQRHGDLLAFIAAS